jgi:hypothetical protein
MRTVNRAATLLLALLLLPGGVLLAVEATLVALDRPALLVDPDTWYAALGSTPAGAPVVRLVASAVLLVGLVVLVAELRRWQPRRIALPGRDGWHLHRRSVERRLALVARDVPGIRRSRVRIRRRGAAWRPRITATGDPTTAPALESAVHRELERLGAPLAARIEVRLPRRERQRR